MMDRHGFAGKVCKDRVGCDLRVAENLKEEFKDEKS
jgi:hypothetical protein